MQHTTLTPERVKLSTSTENILSHMSPLLWQRTLMEACKAHPDSNWTQRLTLIFAEFDCEGYSPLRPTRLWFKNPKDFQPIEKYPFLIDDLSDWLENERPNVLPLPATMYAQAKMMLEASAYDDYVDLKTLGDDELAELTRHFYENVAATLVHMGVNWGILPS